MGRLLANEVCHRARLSPFANTSQARQPTTSTRLCEAIHVCIDEGLAFERGLDEMSSSADRPAHVHNRVGEACPECGDVVRAVEYSRYTVAYCASCQTGGKVLADNTTSKFLEVAAVLRARRSGPSSVDRRRARSTSSRVARVDAGAAEVVDVEALDDLVLAVLGGAREAR